MLAWASVALSKDYAGSKRILVWGASNEGAREAVLVESAGVAA
jgi:3-oxoacyl-[acyl-carrier-protein] synthase-1